MYFGHVSGVGGDIIIGIEDLQRGLELLGYEVRRINSACIIPK